MGVTVLLPMDSRPGSGGGGFGGFLEAGEDVFAGGGVDEEFAVVLLDGAHFVEMEHDLEEEVPGVVVVEDDGGFAGEVFVEGLVADEDGDCLEHVLEGGAGGEDEGVGLDDFPFDIGEADALVAVGVVDVPSGVEEEEEESGASGSVRAVRSEDGP